MKPITKEEIMNILEDNSIESLISGVKSIKENKFKKVSDEILLKIEKPICPKCNKEDIKLSTQLSKDYYCNDCSKHFNL